MCNKRDGAYSTNGAVFHKGKALFLLNNVAGLVEKGFNKYNYLKNLNDFTI